MANLGLAFVSGFAKEANEQERKWQELNQKIQLEEYASAKEEWQKEQTRYEDMQRMQASGLLAPHIAKAYGVDYLANKKEADEYANQYGQQFVENFKPREKPNMDNYRGFNKRSPHFENMRKMIGFDEDSVRIPYERGNIDGQIKEFHQLPAFTGTAKAMPEFKDFESAIVWYSSQGKDVPKEIQDGYDKTRQASLLKSDFITIQDKVSGAEFNLRKGDPNADLLLRDHQRYQVVTTKSGAAPVVNYKDLAEPADAEINGMIQDALDVAETEGNSELIRKLRDLKTERRNFFDKTKKDKKNSKYGAVLNSVIENYETSRVSSPQMSPRDRWRAAVNDALIQIEIEPSSSWFSSDTISTGGIGQSSSVIRQDSNVGGSSGNPTIKRPTNTPQPQGAVSDSVLFLRALPVETRNRVRSGELAARPGNVDGEFVVYDPKYPNSVVQRVNIR